MGNKILRVIERVLCVSVCCCKKWIVVYLLKQRAFKERKKKKNIFVSWKASQKYDPHIQKRKKNEFVFVLPTVSKPYTRTFRTCSFYTCTSAEAIRSWSFLRIVRWWCVFFFWTERALLVFLRDVFVFFFSLFFPSTLVIQLACSKQLY